MENNKTDVNKKITEIITCLIYNANKREQNLYKYRELMSIVSSLSLNINNYILCPRCHVRILKSSIKYETEIVDKTTTLRKVGIFTAKIGGRILGNTIGGFLGGVTNNTYVQSATSSYIGRSVRDFCEEEL